MEVALHLRAVLGQVEQVAATNATVLILGESGTGKELYSARDSQLERPPRPTIGESELRGTSW